MLPHLLLPQRLTLPFKVYYIEVLAASVAMMNPAVSSISTFFLTTHHMDPLQCKHRLFPLILGTPLRASRSIPDTYMKLILL